MSVTHRTDETVSEEQNSEDTNDEFDSTARKAWASNPRREAEYSTRELAGGSYFGGV